MEQLIADTFSIPVEEVTDESGPGNVAGWDSMKHIEIVMLCEAKYGVQFAATELPLLTSVGKIKDILQKKNIQL